MTDQAPVPSIEDANNELLAIQIQILPAQIRSAFLQGVIEGRQAETAEPPPKPAGRAPKKT